MKKYIIPILGILLLWGCNKSDEFLDTDDSFSNPKTGESDESPDTDDLNYIKLSNLRTYVFAGQSNPVEEQLLLNTTENSSVEFKFESVFIPEGDIIEDGNYSFEKPMAAKSGDNTVLFFNRTLKGGKGKNHASGWCFSNTVSEEWTPVVEAGKYAPYGYDKDGAIAFGVSDEKFYFASKGLMFADANVSDWSHYPEALQWSSRDLSHLNSDIGGEVLPNILDTKFGLMMLTESYSETDDILVIAEIKYDTLDMDGEIPIYGTTPMDTIWAYMPIQNPKVPSLIVSTDKGFSWNDYVISANDTLHLHKGVSFSIKDGDYEGSIINMGYDLNNRTLHQAVYRYNIGDEIVDTLHFEYHVTNIKNDMPQGLSTSEIILNPVTKRIELVEGFTNKLVLWSIGIDDLFNGSSDWTRECELINRGDRYAEFADTNPIGSVIDIEKGVQILYLSMGAKSPSRKAIYSLTRDLDTPALANWLLSTRVAGEN